MIATSLRPKKKAREQMLAYIGLTTAAAALHDAESPDCRLTVVPGRLLVTPDRAARRRGVEPLDYAWPAVALIAGEGRFGPGTATLVLDDSGRTALLRVELPVADLAWSLRECGFRVVEVPYAPVGTEWVTEELRPLLPYSMFDRSQL